MIIKRYIVRIYIPECVVNFDVSHRLSMVVHIEVILRLAPTGFRSVVVGMVKAFSFLSGLFTIKL